MAIREENIRLKREAQLEAYRRREKLLEDQRIRDEKVRKVRMNRAKAAEDEKIRRHLKIESRALRVSAHEFVHLACLMFPKIFCSVGVLFFAGAAGAEGE